MDSYGIFHPDTHLQTPNSSFWTPKTSNFGFRGLGFRSTAGWQLAGSWLAAGWLAGWLPAGWLGWTQDLRDHGPGKVNRRFRGPTVRNPDCQQQYSGLHQQDSKDPQDCRTTRLPGLQDC